MLNGNSQCINYTKGLASGSLCYPLCTDEIKYTECLGHGVKPHVLRANWHGKDIILKVKRKLNERRVVHHLTDLQEDMLNRNHFDLVVNLSYINYIVDRNTSVSKNVFDYLYTECAGTDGILTYHEMWYCYALLESDEFLLSVLLKGSYCVPKLYGICGHVFGVEYLPVEMLEALPRLVVDERSWATKARLGLAILDMVKRLDRTPYGTFYLCDIQFTNFGVLKHKSGFLVAPIDVDIAWLAPQMKQVMIGESRVNCSKDSDCHFISCLGRCDPIRKKCDPHSYSNNLIVSQYLIFPVIFSYSFCLQNICRLIFTSTFSFPKLGLFDVAPPAIQPRFSRLLEKCGMPSPTPWPRTSDVMIEQLQRLLHESIRYSDVIGNG